MSHLVISCTDLSSPSETDDKPEQDIWMTMKAACLNIVEFGLSGLIQVLLSQSYMGFADDARLM